MKRKLKIAILYDAGAVASFNPAGAIPPSEDIGVVAEDVANVLRRLGHTPRMIPAVQPIEKSLGVIRAFGPDLVFNLCEGYFGDPRHEGHVAGLLELMRLPYTGNSAFTLHLTLRKGRVKEIFRANRISTPRGFVAHSPFFPWKRQVRFPVIVKPNDEDASVGVEKESIVHRVREIRPRVEYLQTKFGGEVLIEEFIDGREFSVAILGGRVLQVSEIDFSGLPRSLPRIVSYRGKWDEKSVEWRGTKPVVPAPIPRRKRAEVEQLALRCWDVLDGRDYARVDLRMDRRGRLFVLEFNANPDLSRDAGFARCARSVGGSYVRLIRDIVGIAIKRTRREVSEDQPAAQAGGQSDR